MSVDLEGIVINVLGFFDEAEGEWSAVALEMDIWGHGATRDEAFAELDELVEMQVSFAVGQDDLSLLYRPAPQEYWDKFREVRADQFVHLGEPATDPKGKAVGTIRLPEPHVIEAMKKNDRFELPAPG